MQQKCFDLMFFVVVLSFLTPTEHTVSFLFADLLHHFCMICGESGMQGCFFLALLAAVTVLAGDELVAMARAAARKGVPFLHISTDEVYGSAPAGERFAEDDPLRPSSPYAASKAALEALVLTYASELNRTNVKVNLLDPGVVRTAMRAKAFPGERAKDLRPPEDVTDLFVDLALPSCAHHGERLHV